MKIGQTIYYLTNNKIKKALILDVLKNDKLQIVLIDSIKDQGVQTIIHKNQICTKNQIQLF